MSPLPKSGVLRPSASVREIPILGFSRWQLFKALATIVCIVGIVWLALIYFIPAPPSKVTMATAFKGSSFEYYGQQYREIFARFHIELELRETAGAVENVKLLQDPKSGVQIAFVLGGVSDGKHAPGLLSLGTVYNNPYWIFYSSNEPFDRLSQLKGKRIAVGPVGSGTRYAAEQILSKGGINSETATLFPFAGSAAVKALNDGKVDVVWVVGAPDASATQAFLRDPNARLMIFPRAEAFTRIFPELVRLVLPQGVVDIDRDIPPNDVTLIGTTTKVLVRSDLHPEIVQLLLQTMVEAHGGPDIFQRSGEFPNSADTEYPVAQSARDFYKNGPSFLNRYLPFWMTSYVERTVAELVAAIAIGLPVFSYAPKLYLWFIRDRVRKLYRRLRIVDKALLTELTTPQVQALQDDLDIIRRAASIIPMRNSELFFDLENHIERTRVHIASR
jgi:TRAP transporter TAXI family solute receptor